MFKNHDLVPEYAFKEIRYELKPCKDAQGHPVEGLHSAWIILNNPSQLNSYTTLMIKEVILAFRKASNSRDVVAVVFTGEGHRAFCTGGNTKEYAEYYAGQPEEYRQYMRLFNDMVTAILHCDKPVICRVNGMRIAGGQEIGMACDFSVASDLALFGQAGPRHGSAPDGGSTDFLPLYVGIENAMTSCTLCELWSAHKAYRLGLLTDIVPVLKKYGTEHGGPPVMGALVMHATGLVLLLTLGSLLKIEFKTERIATKSLICFISAGVIYAIGSIMTLKALTYAPASVVAPVWSAQPIISFFLAKTTLKGIEDVTFSDGIAAVLVVLGVLVLRWG